ncbi:GntR family transcriptional regulator [Massilia sp. WF1]|uniref:GntR family transcriptional regulator n=1 Tax=unclassified Massilia TaxID=2609279 RepID=UPI000649AA88|nr:MULTISPECIES: GntR family transcriptional regulator [unclassified Massilia]ALK98414.1 GntR family transcriptional regulator [Massilia sp. WG5]KLU37010.1 GntR family transcriptional regulator [Massilia sp. WF1]
MNFTLRHDDRLPLYQRLRDEFSERIAKQQWRPGEAIPTEADLVKQFGASIGTVRKAIDMLVAEGTLERYQGRGTFVRRARFDSSLFRFFRFQKDSGERKVPEGRILRREVMEAPSAVASALRIPAGADVIHLSRLRVLDGTPLLAESIWLPKEKFAALLDIDTSEFGDLLYPLYEESCGQVIASAEEDLTAEAVDKVHARLLQLPPGAPVIVVERLAFGYDRQPLEWRRSRGPADKFRYHVDIR